jgi:folate-dependent tRNA-U54 methylase TrmFO/GidA
LYDEDTTYSSNDTTKKELKEFILNLSQAQFDKINTFYETMPKLQHTFKVTCKNKKCKNKEERTIQGMQSFFG